jgi:hypothetical protein
MYSTPNDLLRHMRSLHSVTQWVCNYCTSRSQTGLPFHFKCFQDWADHAKSVHKDVDWKTQLHPLGRLSQRSMLKPLTCPLCGYTVDKPQLTLDDHFIKHLHEFALHCLSYNTGENVLETKPVDDLESGNHATQENMFGGRIVMENFVATGAPASTTFVLGRAIPSEAPQHKTIRECSLLSLMLKP